MNYKDTLQIALKTPILEFKGLGYEQFSQHAQRANAFLFLVADEKKNGLREPYHARIMQHINSITTGGHEPAIDVLQIWVYPTIACAITICKHTPTIWAELSSDVVERLDFIMTAFALMNNLASNDDNDYMTGLSRLGNFRKNRGPNYRLPVTIPIIAAAYYFGNSDKLDEILTSFDYDEFIAKAENFEFKNLLEVWKTPYLMHGDIKILGAREMLVDGGTTYTISKGNIDSGNIYRGGSGQGAKIPYKYCGLKSDSTGIIEEILKFAHLGGPVTSVAGDNNDGTHLCYILDGSESPVEGRDGMLYEYNLKDSEGIRSDGFYCQVDFSMEIAFLTMLKLLGIWSESLNPDIYEKVWVGNTDHIYKLEKGYMSHAMGMQRIERENNLRGYYFTKAIWVNYFEQLK